jgi:hypothetical protein
MDTSNVNWKLQSSELKWYITGNYWYWRRKTSSLLYSQLIQHKMLQMIKEPHMECQGGPLHVIVNKENN